MDDTRFESADLPDNPEAELAAYDAAAANDGPDPDDAPADEDAPDDGDDDGGEIADDEPEDDPCAELKRLRREMAERDRADRERIEREAQEQRRQQALSAQQEQARRSWQRQQQWNAYQAEKQRIDQARLADVEQIRQSEDPATVARFLNAQRRREEQEADWRYGNFLATDREDELRQTQAALERAASREYASYVREAYGLPEATTQEIMTYSDGTPVHHDAFASRAAEIVERRKAEANLKRQLTKAQREQQRDDLRGRTAYGAGGARGAPANFRIEDITGDPRELEWISPADLGRARRSG